MKINNSYDYNYTPRIYTLSDIMDGKVTIPPPPPTPPDSFVKAKVEAYEAMQKENKKIFS